MPTIRTRTARLVEPPPPDIRRVYMSRGVNLKWRAKRAADGAIVAEADEKRDAMHEAEHLGYIIN
ncbi:MAG TPA: hypothetical protein VNT52_01050 [Acidimicrobiales bacterium]|nr:hypothetical protein [Acidimicrobiales bacterium]